MKGIPANTAKTKYSVPISLALVENNQRTIFNQNNLVHLDILKPLE